MLELKQIVSKQNRVKLNEIFFKSVREVIGREQDEIDSTCTAQKAKQVVIDETHLFYSLTIAEAG